VSRTILFDTIAAGGGHVATARAMRDAVERLSAGEVRGEIRDAMKELGLERQDREHKRSWARLLRTPRLVRAGMRIMNVAPGLVHALEARVLDELARRAASDLASRSVDLVVVNHGFLMVAYARARRRYGLRRPVVTFATEPFDANALWAEPHADRVVAPSHAARRHLIRLGVPGERIDVVGYPVAGALLSPPTREEARRRLDLPVEGRRALLSLGGEGVADRPERWIDAILDAGFRVSAIAGRNAALAERLARHPAAGAMLDVHGFVDDMPLRLAAADVVVGKAGPASVMEALAVGRPFLATSHAGLNEAAVIAYLERSGLGRAVAEPAALAPTLTATEAAQRRAQPDFAAMADRLGGHLLALADGTASPPPLGLDDDPWRGAGGAP
jgi:UDP-N-acetylglucosamine:LPS N-acetylglucosamine transferase